MPAKMQSDRQLRYWYHKYNKAFFNNELPQKILIHWKQLPMDWGSACQIGVGDLDLFYIRLNCTLKFVTQYWKIILLHEMIHVKLWKSHPNHSHGKLFRDETERLFNLGAYKKLL